ncbi:hypothetical protein L1987_56419 [Smallanthus sonchifolius]|uniref:Uncharacterized protein n=2 Tax=Smallanthus sonchifolius TaxID=185202 RepID=A0ACB9EDR7_9ASTR|nr:hypothetical protein L1987_56416 [Smallanthus sonchifolius]KAI3756597.1 hypothetical protein L1987_56419 [Smallanthus sonchifolius]
MCDSSPTIDLVHLDRWKCFHDSHCIKPLTVSSLTSMAMKSIILITVLVVVLVATQAQAQIAATIPLFNITGNVSCSVNGSIVINGTNPIPPFRNALVQLLCGDPGIVRADSCCYTALKM